MISSNQRKIGRSIQKRLPKVQQTKEKLLQTALELLETHFPERITGDMVLEHSGVSRGSLYHHFVDVSDLLEQGLVHRFAARVDANIAALSRAKAECRSAEQMYDQLCSLTDFTQAPENKRLRFVQARLIGFAEDNDRLIQRLGVEQKRLTDAIADLFGNAQEKGWLNNTFNPHTAALFVQAYTLGRVIDDVSLVHVDPDEWNAFIKRVVKMVFC